MKRWMCTDGIGAEVEIDAKTAEDAACEYVQDGEWGDRNETIFVDVNCAPIMANGEADWDDNEWVTVDLEPIDPRPECGHEWVETSVIGHGGGVICTEKCSRCGLIKTTDTWYPRHDGTTATMVSYED